MWGYKLPRFQTPITINTLGMVFVRAAEARTGMTGVSARS